jgi:hypothetical protein
MIFPTWVPMAIAEWVSEYHTSMAEDADCGRDDVGSAAFIIKIWIRLATRPEMESVWNFISTSDTGLALTSNGGLVGMINRGLRRYAANPKLSPKAYSDELSEIAKLADSLSRKLKKFVDAEADHNNPFPLHSLLSDDQKQRAKGMMSAEILASRRGMSAYAIAYYLPPIDELLIGLSGRAKTESVEQFYKLKLPRKVNDKNLFRTYFIREVADYFFMQCADYSPTRIAAFSSVALDDPDITADLVRKLCPLDEEQKSMPRL